MEIRHAQAFLAVAEELNFGRAAQKLFMTQPPLSRLIRALERDLDVELFDRDTHSVSLTPAGAALRAHFRELVAVPERIRSIAERAGMGEVGHLKIGLSEASTSHLLGDVLRRLRHQHPGITLETVPSQFSEVGLNRVLDGSLDMAVGRWEYLPASVDAVVLGTEEIVIALPEDHRLSSQAVLEAEQLADESWVAVLPGPSAALPNQLGSIASRAGFVPRITQICPDSAALLFAVSVGTGIALTVSSVRDNIPMDGVVFRKLNPAEDPLKVQLLWRASNTDASVRTVANLAQDHKTTGEKASTGA